MARRSAHAVLVVLLLAAGCGSARDDSNAPSAVGTEADGPFIVDGGLESGATSGYWGDGGSGPSGMHIGCIRDRQLAVLITVRNRTNRAIKLLGGEGAQPFQTAIERGAVQVRLAPVPSSGHLIGPLGLQSWSDRNGPPAVIPSGRRAWVQSNFLMRDCGSLPSNKAVMLNRSMTLVYDAGGKASQRIAVPAARIILTRGPLHPKVPINTVG